MQNNYSLIGRKSVKNYNIYFSGIINGIWNSEKLDRKYIWIYTNLKTWMCNDRVDQNFTVLNLSNK